MNIFKFFLIMILGWMMVDVPVFQISAQQLATDGKDSWNQSNKNVIVDTTGSSNFSGYRAVIEPSGQIAIMGNGDVSRNKVSPELAKKLIVDLEAVMPLSGLKSVGCFKSASFGTKTFVTYKNQKSPDIQCMKSEGFVKDVDEIIKTIPRIPKGVKLL